MDVLQLHDEKALKPGELARTYGCPVQHPHRRQARRATSADPAAVVAFWSSTTFWPTGCPAPGIELAGDVVGRNLERSRLVAMASPVAGRTSEAAQLVMVQCHRETCRRV